MLYTLALSRVKARLVLRSRARSPSRISALGLEARSSSVEASCCKVADVSTAPEKGGSCEDGGAGCGQRVGCDEHRGMEEDWAVVVVPFSCSRPTVRILPKLLVVEASALAGREGSLVDPFVRSRQRSVGR